MLYLINNFVAYQSQTMRTPTCAYMLMYIIMSDLPHLDFCTPLMSGTMDQCTIELRDSDKGSVAVTIVLLSAVEAYIRSISCNIGKTNTISGFRSPS